VAKTVFKSVDEYMSSQPESAHRMLKRVRAAIRRAMPNADEMIFYGLPTASCMGAP
jgi:uncharacterized protein YdhG (YjbR/CyaY superfamily)